MPNDLRINMEEEAAKKVFFEIDDIFRSIGLRFFLIGGTQLGAIRDKGFISVDWDMDIGCFDEEFDKKKYELLEIFKAKNFNRVHFKRGYNKAIYGINTNKYTKQNNLSNIHCCIMSYKKFNNCRYYLYNGIGDAYVFPSAKLENLKQIDFYGRKVNVSRDSKFILEYVYGKDWRIPHTKQQQVDWFKGARYNLCEKKVDGRDIFWWAEKGKI